MHYMSRRLKKKCFQSLPEGTNAQFPFKRIRLRFLRFSFAQRTQRKRLRLNGNRSRVNVCVCVCVCVCVRTEWTVTTSSWSHHSSSQWLTIYAARSPHILFLASFALQTLTTTSCSTPLTRRRLFASMCFTCTTRWCWSLIRPIKPGFH